METDETILVDHEKIANGYLAAAEEGDEAFARYVQQNSTPDVRLCYSRSYGIDLSGDRMLEVNIMPDGRSNAIIRLCFISTRTTPQPR